MSVSHVLPAAAAAANAHVDVAAPGAGIITTDKFDTTDTTEDTADTLRIRRPRPQWPSPAAPPSSTESRTARPDATPTERSAPSRTSDDTGIHQPGTTAAAPEALMCPTAPDPAAPAAVDVADDTLRAAINRHLNKAPTAEITDEEMAELTALQLRASPDADRITSLDDLEHASNLDTLVLAGHDISMLDSLSCLNGLTTLDLSGNNITDTSALAGLSALEALDVSHNTIAAITPLAGLTNLRSINVGGNQVTSLSALSGLEALYAHDNEITGIAALSTLTSLTRLHLDHNNITGVAALSSLTGLTTLGLGGNQISDIAALRGLTALKALYLFDNDIADATALSGLNSLTTLWIDGNDLTSPYGWTPAGGLGYLDARHNLIPDIAPLDALAAAGGSVHTEPQRVATMRVNDAGLRAALLAASYNQIADPAPLAPLAGLTHLFLTDNHITGLEPLRGLTRLQHLHLRDNHITDFTPLHGIARLTIHGRDDQNTPTLTPARVPRRGPEPSPGSCAVHSRRVERQHRHTGPCPSVRRIRSPATARGPHHRRREHDANSVDRQSRLPLIAHRYSTAPAEPPNTITRHKARHNTRRSGAVEVG